MFKQLLPIFIIYLLCSCRGNDVNNSNNNGANASPPLLSYNIVKVYPHDTSSYTEGLIWQNNSLYESTGNKDKSKVRKINIASGEAEKEIKLDSVYFW